jgi:hypothetical protein
MKLLFNTFPETGRVGHYPLGRYFVGRDWFVFAFPDDHERGWFYETDIRSK